MWRSGPTCKSCFLSPSLSGVYLFLLTRLPATTSSFHTFFNQLDSFATDYFLWVTANGFEGAYERKEKGDRVPKGLEAQLGDEGENPDEGEG